MKKKLIAVKLTRLDWITLLQRLEKLEDTEKEFSKSKSNQRPIQSHELQNLLDAIREILWEEK